MTQAIPRHRTLRRGPGWPRLTSVHPPSSIAAVVAVIAVATATVLASTARSGAAEATPTSLSSEGFTNASSSHKSLQLTATATTLNAAVTDPSVPFGTTDTVSFGGLPTGVTGSVRFTSGPTTLCAVADVTLAASCSTPAGLAVGTHPVTVHYSGDAGHEGSSATTSFAVVKAATAIAARVSHPDVALGEADTLSFTGLPTGATGTVTFTSGATDLCTVDVTVGSTCTTPTTLGTGTYPVTAAYSGDGSYVGSSATTSFSVGRTVTATTVAVTSATIFYGTPDTVSVSGLPVGATGTVTFTSGATTLCSVDITVATICPTPADLVAGGYPVLASYSGDPRFASSSATTGFAVLPIATAFTASVSSAKVVVGSDDGLSFAGLPADATGTVTFRAGGVVLCIVDIAAGNGCPTSSALAVGDHTVTATYSGDVNHLGSAATTQFEVQKIATALKTVPAPPVPSTDETVVLRFRDLPADATGRIVFRLGARVLCTAVLPATRCTVPATTIGIGAFDVRASYSGDRRYSPSAAVLALNIGVAPFTGGGGGGGGLAQTGSDVEKPFLGGLFLLMVGAAMIGFGRARRRRRH